MYKVDDRQENRKFNNFGMNVKIHPTAVIEDGAIIGDNVFIGAFCYVGPNVVIGDNCELKAHVVIEGNTTLGEGNKIYSFAVIGQDPQDLKYEGEQSRIEIGDNNKIREHCTIHPGTKGDHMVTKIGNGNLFMVNTHIAHDCVIENCCVFANNTTLAGHVHVGNHVVIGGLSAVHQFVHIGEHAMIGGMTGVARDIPPYCTALENRTCHVETLNIIGLKRRNFSREEINNLRHFFEDVFESDAGTFEELLEANKDKYKNSILVENMIKFLSRDSKRGFCLKNNKNLED